MCSEDPADGVSLEKWEFRTSFPDAEMKPSSFNLDYLIAAIEADRWFKAHMVDTDGRVRQWVWKKEDGEWLTKRRNYGPDYPTEIDEMLRAYRHAVEIKR